MTPRLSLRSTASLLLLGVSLLATGVAQWLGARAAREQAWASAVATSRTRLGQQRHTLSAALRRGDAAFAAEVVTGLRGDRQVRQATLVDGRGTVLASTRLAWVGRPAAEAGVTSGVVDAARQTLGAVVEEERASGLVVGAVALEPAASTLAQQVPNVLVVEHDVAPALRTASRDALAGTGAVALLVVVAALVLQRLMENLVTRRALRVQQAAAAIAEGRLEARTGVDGGDELGRIGAAVDTMARRLESERLALRESEARYRGLFEQAVDAVLLLDGQARCVDANAAAQALLARSRDALLADSPLSFLPAEARASALTAASLTPQRWMVEGGGGQPVPVDASARALPDGQTLLRLHDARPDVESERLRQHLAVSEHLAALGTLAASVGHEVNNPLTWVAGNLEEALERAPKTDEELRAMLEDALTGARRIQRIVADLRVFSRRKDDGAPGHADLGRVVQATLNMATPLLGERARLEAHLPAGEWRVRGEEARLVQVLLNLLTNAAQAMPAGRPSAENLVTVTVAPGEHGPRLTVTDNGSGIPPRARARLFEPFFTTKPVGQGTGLGLSVSRELLTQAGATLELESTSAAGTTFAVQFAASSAVTPPRPPEPHAGPAPQPQRPSLAVLVVDDEPLLAQALVRLMPRDEVTVADGVAAGLARCRERGFDLVLCDLSMPEGGGQAFLEGLAAVRPAQRERVVFCTGGAMSAQAEAFLTGCGRPVLEKPFSAARLAEVLAEAARAGSCADAAKP